MSKNNPELLDKVEVISGDTSLPNLGMSEDDLKKVCREVTIVFHVAAVINFTKSYREVSLQNAKGVDYVIDFCRKLKKLTVLTYTSTAYANCHIFPEIVNEKVYHLPFETQRFLDEMENGTDESYAKLVESTNLKWPNSYCFSKCLSENILLEKASDLPVGIVRPSIVYAAWKGTLPGYLETGSGVANFTVGIAKGYIRVFHGDTRCIFDVIPVDVVINTHIITAWSVATGRSSPMTVVNCTSGSSMKISLRHYSEVMIGICTKHPFPNSFQELRLIFVKNKFLYSLLTFYNHFVPAVAFDIYLRFKGSKLRLMKLYQYFDKMMDCLHPFTSNTYNFSNDNFFSLSKQLNAKERETIYTDLPTTFYEMVKDITTGSEMCDWKEDKLPQKKRMNIVAKRTMIITFIKRSTLLLFIIFMYLIISKRFL